MKATGLARLRATWAGSLLLFCTSVAAAGEPTHAPRPAKPAAPSKVAATGSRVTRVADGHAPGGSARRSAAPGRAVDDAPAGAQTEELVALREAERAVFSPTAPALESAAPPELPVLLPRGDGPQVFGSGVPPAAPTAPPASEAVHDLSWVTGLEMPDLPVRWDERVVQYIEFFRDDARGHAMFANLFRHSGRFRDMMRRELRRKALPEDLVWVAMIESAFDPGARSPSGAAGLWQFMPETGKIYGLTIDRWLDQRYSPELATDAAADLLGDLHRRLGSWELALAAYNMGYAGLAAVVRRYNTNDFWSLARTEGTLPWQTTLYVPRIMAASVVAHNLAAFGFGEIALDPAVESDQVDVPAAMPLALVARAAGCDSRDVEGLNPELRASRTPPGGDADGRYLVRVPQGKGAALVQALARQHRNQPPVDRYVVHFGETLEHVASAHKTTPQRLVELNAIAPGEVLRGGTTLLVPRVEVPLPPLPADAASIRPDRAEPPAADPRSVLPGPTPALPPSSVPSTPRESVVVPSDEFVYPGRQRVFYRVVADDTPERVASALGIPADDLSRWNGLDPSARLQEGMTLQAFVSAGADLSRLPVVPEANVHVVAVGSEEFFAPLEQSKRMRRVTVAARAGDTLEAIGKRFDVLPRTMEWINRRGRADVLRAGDPVVVYLPGRVASPGPTAVTASNGPPSNGPLPAAPEPDLLP